MNKKALEMSVGLIVVLILSILIFILAMSFLFKWFGQAEELKAEIDKQTQEQILSALSSGNQLVAIPITIQTVKRGESKTFGVGIRNIEAERQFSMAAAYSAAYTPNGDALPVDVQYITDKWLGTFATTSTFILKKNEQKSLPLLIRIDAAIASGRPTPIGDYVFNVCVYPSPLRSDNTPPAPCTAGQYKNNPEVFYTQKIYQVTVKVR